MILRIRQLCKEVFVALLSALLTLQHVAAVVNNGQTKKIEEPAKTASESEENQITESDKEDSVAESSETANRREAPAILDTYGTPPSSPGVSSLPVPVYGVPSSPSNNVVYPGPPPDIPPPPPKIPPVHLYGAPGLGKTYGAPQVTHVTKLPSFAKTYGTLLSGKYGAPAFSYNQFNQYAVNLSPPKAIYGPPKNLYGPPPGKPLRFNKQSLKNFGLRSPKPVYGAPFGFKDNFSYNKLNLNTHSNNLYTGNLFSNNAFSNNLYSGVSSLNHQYGAPILPPKETLSLQYGTPASQYGVPAKVIAPGPQLLGYGPPQPSPNPKPPHPGAPAPPTPPDIKYDGWHPIPGLVSKRPLEEVHHTGEGSGYHDLSPPPLEGGHNQVGVAYGAPPVTLDISLGTSLSEHSVTNSKGVSDSYSAPLGTVTGSGGVVASSGAEAHAGSISHSDSPGVSHTLTLDLSSIGVGHGADIQATKSIEYDISPQSGSPSPPQISETYGAPQALGGSYSSDHSYAISSHGYKGTFAPQSQKGSALSNVAIGLVPPSGVYGAPPSSQYGTPLYTSTHGSYKPPIRQGLYTSVAKGNSYLPPPLPIPISSSYGSPISSEAISFQNVAHGSSSAGFDFQHNTLNIEGASALPLTSYNVPLGAVEGSYTLPAASGGDTTVSLDYSHPPVSIDLTEAGTGRQQSLSSLDCYNKQQLPVPSLAYGVPSADSYTSSLSSLTTNIATSLAQTAVPQPTYGTPDLIAPHDQISVPSPQYGVPDLQHSPSIKTESKANSVEDNEETHGKNYGQSVAASFGPNSELVESQSIDLNNIPLQGALGSYTLQIQSADGGNSQIPHTQVLNEGLLQSILQAIEQPGKQGENAKYPIILQPSVERNNYSFNETVNKGDESTHSASEIREIIVEAPKSNNLDDKAEKSDNEETLQLLDTSNIALYYKKDDDTKKINSEEKSNDNTVDNDNESI